MQKRSWRFLSFAAAFLALCLGVFLPAWLIYDAAEESGFLDVFWPLAKTMMLVREGYVEPLSSEETTQKLLRGFVGQLDPHSSYLTPQETAHLRQETQGSYGGIGISTKSHPSGKSLLIHDIYPKGPADRAGLRKGDQILGVDGQLVPVGKTFQILEKIRGPQGSQVKLSVLAKGADEPKDVLVSRQKISSPTAQRAYWPATKTIIIRVRSFGQETSADLAGALSEALRETPHPSGIILDVRDNLGGLLSAAVAATSFFVPEGSTIVVHKRRHEEEKWKATPEFWRLSLSSAKQDPIAELISRRPDLRTLPIAVLINQNSASASEILAAALRDLRQAPLVGAQTFGKGSVQSIFPLGAGQGAVKLTIGRYYTPSGVSIQAVGLIPDVIAGPQKAGLSERLLPRHLNQKGAASPEEAPALSEQELGLAPEKEADIPFFRTQSVFTTQIQYSLTDEAFAKALGALGAASKSAKNQPSLPAPLAAAPAKAPAAP